MGEIIAGHPNRLTLLLPATVDGLRAWSLDEEAVATGRLPSADMLLRRGSPCHSKRDRRSCANYWVRPLCTSKRRRQPILCIPTYSIVSEIHRRCRSRRRPTAMAVWSLPHDDPYFVPSRSACVCCCKPKKGQMGRELAIKDAVLFQWFANNQWLLAFPVAGLNPGQVGDLARS